MPPDSAWSDPLPRSPRPRTFCPTSGPLLNEPNQSVSSLIGGSTANVLFAGLQEGAIGIYQVVLQLSSGLPTNPLTRSISRRIFIPATSTTIPVFAPNPSGGTSQ